MGGAEHRSYSKHISLPVSKRGQKTDIQRSNAHSHIYFLNLRWHIYLRSSFSHTPTLPGNESRNSLLNGQATPCLVPSCHPLTADSSCSTSHHYSIPQLMKSLPIFILVLARVVATAQPAVPITSCAQASASCGYNKPCCDEASYACRGQSTSSGTYTRCVPRAEVCHATGSACDAVGDTRPCCDVEYTTCSAYEGDPSATPIPGKFCNKVCYEENERCVGQDEFPYIVWKKCCGENMECRPMKGSLWGQFCQKVRIKAATAGAV